MGRFFTILAVGLGACGLWGMAAETACTQMERVNLLRGGHYDGFIESEDELWLHFIQIERPPGKPMRLVSRTLDRGLDRLGGPSGRPAAQLSCEGR